MIIYINNYFCLSHKNNAEVEDRNNNKSAEEREKEEEKIIKTKKWGRVNDILTNSTIIKIIERGRKKE